MGVKSTGRQIQMGCWKKLPKNRGSWTGDGGGLLFPGVSKERLDDRRSDNLDASPSKRQATLSSRALPRLSPQSLQHPFARLQGQRGSFGATSCRVT